MKLLRQIFILASLASITLSGCNSLPGALDSSKQVKPVETESYSKKFLLGILDDQEMLVEQIREAKNSGDMTTAKNLLAEFEVMEIHFNAELEGVKGSLSSVEATEISRRHSEIIRKLN